MYIQIYTHTYIVHKHTQTYTHIYVYRIDYTIMYLLQINQLQLVGARIGLYISRFSISGAHAHWVGSLDTCSHATKGNKCANGTGVTGQNIHPARVYPGILWPRPIYTRGIFWPKPIHTPSVHNIPGV